jgi:replication factor A1
VKEFNKKKSYRSEKLMVKVAELRPFMKKVDLTVKCIEVNEPREVTSKLDNSTHKVTEALVGDDSGAVLLTLWDDAIQKVEPEKTYKITNGYTSLFKNSLRLNIGRYGQLEETEETIEVNKENNLSEKEFSSGSKNKESQ